jgi:hypothetical protein
MLANFRELIRFLACAAYVSTYTEEILRTIKIILINISITEDGQQLGPKNLRALINK